MTPEEHRLQERAVLTGKAGLLAFEVPEDEGGESKGTETGLSLRKRGKGSFFFDQGAKRRRRGSKIEGKKERKGCLEGIR